MSPNQPLPQKENALFKKILRCYEHKQYKNGLKLAKQILTNPKLSEHGETLAMKGLILNCLGKKDEAYEHVKRGLKSDVKSHVCWHVFGLLQRSDRKYDEAIRAYRNALKCDSDNIQILRDLSLLQIQMRDLEGYKETRHKLFTLRSAQKASWIGFAMSYHLLENYEMAVSIIDEFLKIQKKTGYDYEQSELLLYQIQILYESGNYEEVLKRITQYESLICDKLSLMETQADVYLKLKMFDDAQRLYGLLIKRNPEHRSYYQGMIAARQLTKDEDKVLMFEEFKKQFPRAQTPRRLPLNMSQGETFKKLVDEYMRKAITKGVPPLFVDLKSLYQDKAKVEIIGGLIDSYLENLEGEKKNYDGSDDKEPVTAYLWALFYAAQHYDYLENFRKAVELIDKAIEHTPTLIELYLVKGKIFKHAGRMDEAAELLDRAQELDTADRYINSKCARYLLKANKIDDAEKMCAKFTREGVSANENLNEMQCMWYQTEVASAHSRLKDYGETLRKCHEVDRHFVEIIEDQFDFHTYCMRKMTLRSYIGLLRLENVVREHPFYFKAAKIAIETYLKLHDEPLGEKKSKQEELESNLSPSELKKLRSKQKKAEMVEKMRQDVEKENKVKQNKEETKEDESLNPDKLARPENALDEAIKFLRPLQELSPKKIETHLLSYEIYKRRNKPLLMLQSLKRAHRLQPDHPRLHSCIVHFQSEIVSRSDLPASVKQVITNEWSKLCSTPTAKDTNYAFLNQHCESYPHVLEAAKVLYTLDKSLQKEALEWVTLKREQVKYGINFENCKQASEWIRAGVFGPCEAEQNAFENLCTKKFDIGEIRNLH